MLVCVCYNVSDKKIDILVRGGCKFKDIRRITNLGKQCGKCVPCAKKMVAEKIDIKDQKLKEKFDDQQLIELLN